MATLRELVWDIRDIANGGRTTRSHTYSDLEIAFWIRRWRNFLLKNDIKKYSYVPQGYVQDLGCLTLTKADVSLCSNYCFGENTYYVEIPEVIDLPDNMGLTFFGLIDKQTKINISDYNYGNYHNYSRFTPKNKIWGEKIDNTIYLHSVDDVFPIKTVNVQGVFSNPANLSTCSDPDNPIVCYNWDTDCYPIPPGMESTLFDLIIEREMGIARSNKPVLPDDSDNERTVAPL